MRKVGRTVTVLSSSAGWLAFLVLRVFNVAVSSVSFICIGLFEVHRPNPHRLSPVYCVSVFVCVCVCVRATCWIVPPHELDSAEASRPSSST
jgi:hypothetical protein